MTVIIPLSVIALVLPNFTTSTAGGTLSLVQAIFFSVFTLTLYGLFLWLQAGRHRGFFETDGAADRRPDKPYYAHIDAPATSSTRLVASLLVNILPIVILAKSMA